MITVNMSAQPGLKVGDRITLRDAEILWHYLPFWRRALIWLHLAKKPESLSFQVVSVSGSEVGLSDEARR